MKRTIELYIDGKPADLDATGLVLLNYAFTDLEKPTAVKNSYSKQITLPGTPANADIFGSIARLDRRTEYGFYAGRKTAFDIFNELGEKVVSGYIRLDSVTRKGQIVTGYKCSLFGGLGSFFYSLSYDEDGNKRTLADLQYLSSSPTELDFDITASNVKAAWARIYTSPNALVNKWDVINFAPAYNGCPDGDFSADKGIVSAGDVGLQTSVPDGTDTYVTNAGNTLVNLPHGVDEWAAKDLRCYLQRPVLSMKAFLYAIANPANNGGFEVDYSALDTTYKKIWKTLPTIPSLGGLKQSQGTATATAQVLMASHPNGDHNVMNVYKSSGTIPSGATCSYDGSFYLWFAANASGASLSAHASQVMPGSNRSFYLKDVVIFAQLVAYAADNTMVGGSRIKVITSSFYESPAFWAEKCEYTAPYAAAELETSTTPLGDISLADGYYKTANSFAFSVEGIEISKMLLHITAYNVASQSWVVYGRGGREEHRWQFNEKTGGTSACPVLYASYTSEYQTYVATSQTDGATQAIRYSASAALRSGAHITKQMLLSSKYTPAEYLIAFCKQFGILFLCDETRKKITLLCRNDFFDTELPIIDITSMVDKSKEITIQPLAMKAKWYALKNAIAEGSFAKEYKDVYGVDYAIQRVNTGYDFDAAEEDLMQGTPFRGAASILQSSKYWVKILVNNQFRPSPFLDHDVTYTLWS